jgi:hypothetical protein
MGHLAPGVVMKEIIKKRLRERSTYVGLAVLLGLAGVSVPADALQTIGAGLLGLVGLIETMRSEK